MELGRWPACLCEDQKAQLAGTHPVGHVPQAIARHHRMADNQPQHAESGQPRRGDTARERLPQLLVVGYEREPVSQGRARHSCRRRRNQPHGGGRAARVVDRRRGIRRGRATARQDRMDLPRRVPRFFMRVHRTDVLRPSEQQRYRADTRHAVMVAGFRHGILPVGLGATSGRSVPADRRGRGCPCRRLPSGDHAGGAGACPVR